MFWATRHGHPESSEAAPAQFAPLMGVEPGRSLRSQHPLFFWTQKSRCIQLRQSCFHYCGNDVLREERRKAVRSGGYIPSECPRASQAACSGQGGEEPGPGPDHTAGTLPANAGRTGQGLHHCLPSSSTSSSLCFCRLPFSSWWLEAARTKC